MRAAFIKTRKFLKKNLNFGRFPFDVGGKLGKIGKIGSVFFIRVYEK